MLIHSNFGCKYLVLVDMIVKESKMDMRMSCLKIEHVADVGIATIRITNDNSFLFMHEVEMQECLYHCMCAIC